MSVIIKLASGRQFNNITTLEGRDRDHTPHNKRYGEVSSLGIIAFERHDKAGWLSVRMEEITTTDSGRTTCRTISMTLDKLAVKQLADMLASNE